MAGSAVRSHEASFHAAAIRVASGLGRCVNGVAGLAEACKLTVKRGTELLRRIRSRLDMLLVHSQLAAVPRYRTAFVQLRGKRLEIIDSLSFRYMYDQIWIRDAYRFRTRSRAPVVIDAGANIGLATIRVKEQYPEARVLAFEPDPRAFGALRRNVSTFGLKDVELFNMAAWVDSGLVTFRPDGADGGRITSSNSSGDTIEVPCVRLREAIVQRIGLLKLDVEGAETRLLGDIHDRLGLVENLFVEYHSYAGSGQTLHTVLEILSDAGFRVALESTGVTAHPMEQKVSDRRPDLLVNIYAFRPQTIEDA